MVIILIYAPQQAPNEVPLTGLINDLNAILERIVLVLDNYYEITDPAVHQAWAFLIDHQPAGSMRRQIS
jgi:ATP/maltotriose-dependent transcriptional regulator MalT